MALTADEVQPLERHAEWRAADVADPEVWTHRLTTDEITELEAALAHARAHVDDVLDVTKALFPLDALVPVLAEIAEQLINGRGFYRISACPSIGSVPTMHRGSTGASACISACRGHRTPRAICSAM